MAMVAVAPVPKAVPFVFVQTIAFDPLVAQSPLSSEDAPVLRANPVPVSVPCLAFNCVWILEVGSTYPNVVGVTPSTVLFVRVCVSVVPTIVPVGAGTELVTVEDEAAIGICVAVIPDSPLLPLPLPEATTQFVPLQYPST